MSFGAMVPIIAGASAAQRRRQMLEKEEEEEMAQYTREDLDNEWEFKIVRSGTAAFRKREVLDKVVEEEARAGWVMLEKLDDSRIRFKRPRRARAQDAYLPPEVDPYRTTYGASSYRQVAIMLTIVGLTVFMVLGMLLFGIASRR
jgi:hypothetical protein